ncbi:ribonuclease P [Sporodiniella umbellata]|nr:ribonuclease P [Sporodiniella umbellata]
MHSVDTDLNTDNVAVLNGSGVLSLSLTKDTYEKFGIQAEYRSKAATKHNKYIVNVPLKEESFRPGSKRFERLKWCFENTLSQPFKLIFSAVDKLTGIPVDIKWPDQTKDVIKKDIEPQFETLTDIQIPSFENISYSLDQEQKEDWDKHVMNAAEWIGLAYSKSSRILRQTTKSVDPFVSVYKAPSPFSKSTTGTLVKWKGLITTHLVHNVMTITRKLMVSNVLSEWTSLSVWGYRDSPYTWDKKEHYSYLNSENDFTFLLIPKHKTAYTIQFYGSHHSKA